MKTVCSPWRNPSRLGIMCLALLAGGCSGSYSIPGFHAYQIEIQQGNAITHEMVAKLKPGMTRAQVRFALGTPLIVDPFRKDRWDYVYYDEKPGAPRQYRHVAVFFKGDRLERLETDIPAGAGSKEGLSTDKPAAVQASGSPDGSATTAKSGQDAAGSGAPSSAGDKPAQAEPAEERGFFGRIFDSLGF
jgi:outer membrane protein assembly factor BamE